MGNNRQRSIELYQVGAQHHDNRQFEEAVKYYYAALETDPSHELIYNDLSAALFNLGRHEEALPFIERAFHGRPNHIPVLANYLSCLNELKRYDEARRVLDTAVGQGLDIREKFSWPMVKVVADIYFMTQDLPAAQPLYDSLLTKYPDNYNCLMKAAFCSYNAVQLEKTLDLLKKVRKVADDCPVACVQMARCYRDCGLPGMARKYYRLARELDPSFLLDDLAEFA